MIPSFSGPNLITTPHARLLYCEFASGHEAWASFASTVVDLDEIIEGHPRLEKANEYCYFFFFENSDRCWIGREIIGHQSAWPAPFAAFDSYKGEAFEWLLEGGSPSLTMDTLLASSQKLRGLAGQSLAGTWRIKIGPMETLDMETDDALGKMPNISFQFFKSH